MNEQIDNSAPEQTIIEEIFNATTHGLGALLSVIALITLVSYATSQQNTLKIVSCSLFGASLVILYTASTLYHAFQQERIKRILRILDHSSIYILIAGTYTPLTLVNLHGPWGWSLFGTAWGFALGGIIFKLIYKTRFELLSTLIYLLMGWLAIIVIKPIIHSLPIGGLIWLALGGIFYTFGVIFYAWERLHFNHTIWHLFVLAGSACHFFCILFYVIPAHI